LRENATYPGDAPDRLAAVMSGDSDIFQALADANVDYLVTRHGLDEQVDLDDILSGGEKQRLGFARVLLRRRLQLVLLDEATSGLDEANESHLYGRLREQVPCYVSVGHKPNLERFHTHKLLLERVPGSGCRGRIIRLQQ